MTTTDVNKINETGRGRLPEYLGIKMIKIDSETAEASMSIMAHHLAPNDYLHAGSIVTLADTTCGNACMANLPEKANGFTTIELKSNHLATATDGILMCSAFLVHSGRKTQVWDAQVTHKESGRTLALFRCTQMILYPKNQ